MITIKAKDWFVDVEKLQTAKTITKEKGNNKEFIIDKDKVENEKELELVSKSNAVVLFDIDSIIETDEEIIFNVSNGRIKDQSFLADLKSNGWLSNIFSIVLIVLSIKELFCKDFNGFFLTLIILLMDVLNSETQFVSGEKRKLSLQTLWLFLSLITFALFIYSLF